MEDDDEALAVGAIDLARRSAWSAIVGATADDMPPADPVRCAEVTGDLRQEIKSERGAPEMSNRARALSLFRQLYRAAREFPTVRETRTSHLRPAHRPTRRPKRPRLTSIPCIAKSTCAG